MPVNNAGVGFGAPGASREISRDGHELRSATLMNTKLVTTTRAYGSGSGCSPSS
jgi:hypothetical protein